MTAVTTPYVYYVDLPEDSIIEASSLFMREGHDVALQAVLDETVERTGLDEDDAIDLLREHASVWDLLSDEDPEALAILDWEIQRLTAEAGAALGYLATAGSDEQGSVFFVDTCRVQLYPLRTGR